MEKVNCPREDRAEAMQAQISRPRSGWGPPLPARPARPALLPGDGGQRRAPHAEEAGGGHEPGAPHLGAVCAAAAGSRGNTRARAGCGLPPPPGFAQTPGSAVSAGRARRPSEGSKPSRGAAAPPLPPHHRGARRRPGRHRRPGRELGGARPARPGADAPLRPPATRLRGLFTRALRRRCPGVVNRPLLVQRKMHGRSGRWEKISHCPPDCESESQRKRQTHTKQEGICW